MAVIEVALEGADSWEAAHATLARALRLPDYYGRNGNAFIDCLSDITHGRDVPPLLAPGETLTIDLGVTDDRNPAIREVTEAIRLWVAAVNWQDMQEGLPARVLVAGTSS